MKATTKPDCLAAVDLLFKRENELRAAAVTYTEDDSDDDEDARAALRDAAVKYADAARQVVKP